MAELISVDSGETTHSGLDLFGTPDTQTSILKTEDFPLTPLNQITEETINFSFNGDQYRYVDLAASYLYVRVKITKANGDNLEANANVGFVNNVLDSLFQEMRVTLEAETITPSDRCHHYKAYMHRLLSEAEAEQSTIRQIRGWYLDTPDKFEDVAPVSQVRANKGFEKRRKLTATSKEAEFMGRLRIGFFEQQRFLPPGLRFSLTCYRAPDKFVIMGAGKLVFIEAKLFLRMISVSPALQEAQMNVWKKHPLKFPYSESQMLTFPIRANGGTISQEFPEQRLPKRLTVAFVRSDAFNGDSAHNPFYFQHFNCSSMVLKVNGQPIPADGAYINDFAHGKFLRSLTTLYDGTGKWERGKSLVINAENYAKGFTMWVFDLTSDNSSGGHFYLERKGNLHLEARFDPAPTVEVTMLALMEFQELIAIDFTRKVTKT